MSFTIITNNEKEDLIIDQNDIKYEITTTNKKNNENRNISIIKLSECENKLKHSYNLSENDSLVIFKIDKYIKGLKTPKVEYEIYDIKNKRNLDLNICKDLKIKLLLYY